MPVAGLEQAAKVIGAATLFSVTSLIGSPIAGAVVTGVGGPVLDVVTREGLDYIRDKWTSGKHEINHDLQKAMQMAFANATARLETQWWETDHATRLTKAQRVPLETFFDTFKTDIAWVFSDDQLSTLSTDIQARKTDTAARADFQHIVDDKLGKYLHGHDDALYDFLRRRLVAEAALCFTEELKANDRAWRAWQMLLNEGVQTGLNESLRKQDRLAVNVEQLMTILDEVRAQGVRLSSMPEDRRDPWGEATLSRVHDRLARKMEEEARRTRDEIQREHELTRATVTHGNEEIKQHLHGIELTLTSLAKSETSFTAGELLQTATEPRQRIWNVPHSRNPNFTGRDALLGVLATATGPAGTPLTHAIVGMGGVGKSQLAAEYAYAHSEEFSIVWWIRAEKPGTLVGDFAALASGLGLSTTAIDRVEDIAAAVRSRLEQSRQSWLLIFDNAESPGELAPLLPRLGSGRVLITSRLHGWNHLASPLDVDVLEPEEAVHFLLRRTGQTDERGASALIEQIDGLPLALEQAAAYIVEHGTSFDRYLELFEIHAARLLGEQHATVNTKAAVTTTWLVSIRIVAERSPAAVDLLSLCACFAPDVIPLDVMSVQASELPERLASALTDPLAATETVGILYRYSLVDVINDTTVSMHRLVQLAVRENISAEDRTCWSGAAIRLMRRAYPFDRNDPGTWCDSERLMPHALATCDAAMAAQIDAPSVSYIRARVGVYLQTQGQYPRAKDLLEQALASDLATYGPTHPEVATRRNHLGSVLRALGDLAGAKSQLEQALASDLATYGPTHPEVADDRNDLGGVLRALGDLAGAKALYEQALASDRATYGPDHSTVATRRSNLGGVLRASGDLVGAKTLYEQALASDLATYGADHPRVATRRNNLGRTLQDLGDLAGAKALYEQALASDRATYGPDHPRVAIRRSNLGGVLQDLGDLAGAKSELEQALASDLATYGPDHPLVATRRVNLSSVLKDLGDVVEAREQFAIASVIWQARGDTASAAKAQHWLNSLS